MLVQSCSAFKPYGIIFHVKPSIDRTLEKKIQNEKFDKLYHLLYYTAHTFTSYFRKKSRFVI